MFVLDAQIDTLGVGGKAHGDGDGDGDGGFRHKKRLLEDSSELLLRQEIRFPQVSSQIFMSILPTQNQGSTSSSPVVPSQNPSLDHGILLQPHPSPLSRSPPSLPHHVQHPVSSLHISDSTSSVASSDDVSGGLS